MPKTGDHRGHLAYHWRHGWIPLDHFAALSKAKGSHKGAEKIMQKHGIGEHRHEAHPAPHTLKPGEHATVKGVDEYGSPIHFTGEVRGTTAVTMSKGGKKTPMLGITVKRESATTGAMRHDTVYVPDPNRDPAKIDAARKAGAARDQLRRDLNAKYASQGSSYMRQVHGIDPAAMSTTDLAKYRESLHAEHDHVLLSDGKKLRDKMDAEHAKRADIVNSRAETQRSQAEHLRAAAVAHGIKKPQPSSGDLSDAAAQWKRENPGKTIAGHEREVNRIAERLAERKFIDKNATGDTAAQHAAERKRVKRSAQVGSSALLGKMLAEKQGGSASKSDPAASVPDAKSAVAKARAEHGVGSPQHMAALGKLARAQREQQKAAPAPKIDLQSNVNSQAEIADAAHRQSFANLKRSDAARLRALRDPHAARAAQLREAAAKKRAEAERIANGAGVPERAAAMLSGRTHQRQVARDDSALRRYTEKQREASALESKAHLAEGRAKSAAEKQSAADLALTPSKLSRGDLIQHKGQAHMVTKVNKTTVSVPSIVGGSWEDKVPIGGISQHVKLSDMKDSTLRTLMSRAKGNDALQAIYAAELKRRGLL